MMKRSGIEGNVVEECIASKNSVSSFSNPVATSSPVAGSSIDQSPVNYNKKKYSEQYMSQIALSIIEEEKEKMELLISEINNMCNLEKIRYSSEAVHYSLEKVDKTEMKELDKSRIDNQTVEKEENINPSDGESYKTKSKSKRQCDKNLLHISIKAGKESSGTERRKNKNRHRKKASSSDSEAVDGRVSKLNIKLASQNNSELMNTNRNRTPLRNCENYKVAAVTPRANITAPTTILRRPNPGEMAISITGSPLLVATDQIQSRIPQITIPLEDGRVMAILGKDGLTAENFPELNRTIISQLENLHNFLEAAIKDGK